MNTSLDAILVLDEHRRIREVNPAAARLFQLNDGHHGGLPVSALLPGFDGGVRTKPDLETGPVRIAARRADRSEFPAELSFRVLPTDGGGWSVAFVRDISDLVKHERELTYQAHHDALTGLPNRTFLFERMDEVISAAAKARHRCAVLLLDLDRFKEVNDTLGHHVGDQLLRQVCERLQGTLRELDMLARIGGDEFAILMPHADEPQARTLATRMLKALELSFECEGFELTIGASVGIALFPEHGEVGSDLLRHADVAMYLAKDAKRPVEIYDAERDRNNVRNLTLMGELRRAIEENQLTLYFQPQVAIADHTVRAAEALVRWTHPKLGIIPPSEFIHIAEQSGLIVPLTEWVLKAALAEMESFRAEGFADLRLSVNLSTRNLLDRNLPENLEALLESRRLAADMLTLEITESAIMQDPDLSKVVIGSLHDLGVRLAIDDFGTGYSSLGYLKELPVHELKIDKSFVESMTTNASDRTIVKSTIDLAHNLGLEAVAEGVETTRSLNQLATWGCDLVQGFYLGHPLPAPVFPDVAPQQKPYSGRPAPQGRFVEQYPPQAAPMPPSTESAAPVTNDA